MRCDRSLPNCLQVNLMRFSSVFQLPAVPQQHAQPVHAAASAKREIVEKPAAAAPGHDLPEDLDARVRLIGEWQLGEGY
jgi:hypothetical protein